MRSGKDIQAPEITIFGERLCAVMKHDGISSAKLSEITGITQPTLSRYRTKVLNPSLDKAVAIARALDVSLDWLCGLVDD